MLALVLTEVALSIWAPQPGAPPDEVPAWSWGDEVHQASSVPGLLYELRPDADSRHRPRGQPANRIHTNSHGLRGKEVTLAKPPGVRRVAVLGDSTTFGYGVEDDQTYAAVLERLLAQADPEHGYEVLNFGVAGYNTRDEALVLEHKALAFDPDVVVLGYNLNDPDADSVDDPLHNFFRPVRWWQHFNLGRLIWTKQREAGITSLGGGNVLRYWHAKGYDNWHVVEQGFERIAELARGAHAGLLLVLFTFGNPTDDPATYPYRDLHAQVAEEGRRNGFEVLDLAPVYARMKAAGERSQLPHQHPNPAGHRAAAEAIRDRLLGDPARFFGE